MSIVWEPVSAALMCGQLWGCRSSAKRMIRAPRFKTRRRLICLPTIGDPYIPSLLTHHTLFDLNRANRPFSEGSGRNVEEGQGRFTKLFLARIHQMFAARSALRPMKGSPTSCYARYRVLQRQNLKGAGPGNWLLAVPKTPPTEPLS